MNPKYFKVISILNNNAIIALDNNSNKELIVYGNGIGFNSKKGDLFSSSAETKTFVMVNEEYKNKFLTVLDEIPFDCIEITQKIVDMAEKRLNKKLNYFLLFNLADHINFTVKRYKEAIDVPSLINEEVKRFYLLEYEIGADAVKLVNDWYHIRLNDTEAAAIAFHIINAMEANDNAETRKILFGVRDIVSITEASLNMKIDLDSMDYSRYAIHLKYFLKSILTHKKKNNNNNNFLFTLLSQTNAGIVDCLNNIDDYTLKIFNYKLSKEDRIYLTIHLMRLLGNK